ncbi:MAG TPA: chemotaxis protein CheW [Verrucomicrobiae bacterium]|jgi:purine-binding chemotaxis protein CheW
MINEKIHNDKDILRARAQALARPLNSPSQAEATLDLLEFRLAQERYALETRWVREVTTFSELTPVPCCPAFVLGIVNVRGRIVPVLDIKRFFDLPEKGLTDLHRIVLVGGNGMELGILADTIVGLRTIPAKELEDTLTSLTGVRGEYLKGVTAERLIVIDLGRILADPKIIVHEEVET